MKRVRTYIWLFCFEIFVKYHNGKGKFIKFKTVRVEAPNRLFGHKIAASEISNYVANYHKGCDFDMYYYRKRLKPF